MSNPFSFGKPVEGEFYLERKDLRNTVLNFLTNGINVVLVGPRRLGKTSFILDLLKYQEKELGRTCVLVDIFNITSHRDFLQQLFNAVREKQSLFARLRDWVHKLPSSLTPVLAWESEDAGKFSLRFSPHKASDEEIKQLILETLDSLGRIDSKLCVAFDEFQSIARIEDNGWLEATLRSKMQEHKETSFIFSGSRRGIIHDMFNNSARPFYRACQLIDFPGFGPEFTHWIIGRFKLADVTCTASVVDYMRELVSDMPNYVQMLCFHIVASGHKHITRAIVHDMLRMIVAQNAYAYQTLLNSLTLPQQRVLRLAACERENVFAKENLEKYDIKTPSHVAGALNALKGKQILDETTQKGRAVFDDPLFALGLQYQFTGSIDTQPAALPGL